MSHLYARRIAREHRRELIRHALACAEAANDDGDNDEYRDLGCDDDKCGDLLMMMISVVIC